MTFHSISWLTIVAVKLNMLIDGRYSRTYVPVQGGTLRPLKNRRGEKLTGGFFSLGLVESNGSLPLGL